MQFVAILFILSFMIWCIMVTIMGVCDEYKTVRMFGILRIVSLWLIVVFTVGQIWSMI